MNNNLILEGKTYISAKQAAKTMQYAQDYIGQLCRANKLDCRMVGHSWFVTEESLTAHRDAALKATSERVVKTTEKNTEKYIEKKEEEKIEIKPEITKLPPAFTLPDPPVVSAFPIAAVRSAQSSRSTHPLLTSIIILAVAVSGFAFSISLSYLGGAVAESIAKVSTSSSDQASALGGVKNSLDIIADRLSEVSHNVSAFFSNLFSNIKMSDDSDETADRGREASEDSAGRSFTRALPNDDGNNPGNAPAIPLLYPAINASNLEARVNGMAVFPSSTVPGADEQTKIQIRKTFSDEVNVRPDAGGASGVITPVFKKRDGKDFIYVLVPVKEGGQGQ